MSIMKETHNQGLMFDYPDKTNVKETSGYMLNKK